MTSFIVVARDKKRRTEYIKKYCKDLGIDVFDVTLIEKDTSVKQNVNSIGIEDIKNMQKKLFLKPIKSPVKAIVLEDAQMLTNEAQNSMLKILEEPPDNTIIILSAETKEAFLPTIISRCKVVQLEDVAAKMSEKERAEIAEFLDSLVNMHASEKLKQAEILAKDKEKAVEWVYSATLILREKIIAGVDKKNTQQIERLKKFNTVYSLLKNTNTNPRIAIESALLDFGY